MKIVEDVLIIKEYNSELVCMQVRLSNRQVIVKLFKKLLLNEEAIRFLFNDKSVIFKISKDNFTIDCKKEKEIIILITEDGLIELIEALEEHIVEDGIYPLDHSFETLGAKILPNHIVDVVFETIPNDKNKNYVN